MNQWQGLKWRLVHVMQALTHIFISVYHEVRDINLLLVASKKVFGSEERISSKMLNCFNLCKHVCETSAGLFVSVLTVTHLKT